MKALAYFDLFNYPLTKEEIYSFCSHQAHPDEMTLLLQQLVNSRRIFRLGHFYSLQNNYSLHERRIAGNQKASLVLKTGYKISVIL